MNQSLPLGVLRRMRDARLRTLRALPGGLLAGSLVRLPGHRSRYLTDKVAGKTRTLYIPLDQLEEVTRWNRNFQEAKRLLQELADLQRRLLVAAIEAKRR